MIAEFKAIHTGVSSPDITKKIIKKATTRGDQSQCGGF